MNKKFQYPSYMETMIEWMRIKKIIKHAHMNLLRNSLGINYRKAPNFKENE